MFRMFAVYTAIINFSRKKKKSLTNYEFLILNKINIRIF